MYIFCNLVSGGLPWMKYAAVRNKCMCQKLKERVHGEGDYTTDHTHELLMGDKYHTKLYRQEQQKLNGEAYNTAVPSSLVMARDAEKVDALCQAFKHLAGLTFWDIPNYNLIRDCIKVFLKNPSTHPPAPEINWEDACWHKPGSICSTNSATFDAVTSSMFLEANKEVRHKLGSPLANKDFCTKLPVEKRFCWTQLEYNALCNTKVPLYIALHDWLLVVTSLLNDEWNSREHEVFNQTNADGFQCSNYLSQLEKCAWWAAESFGNFMSHKAFYDNSEFKDNNGGNQPLTQRKLLDNKDLPLSNVSRMMFALKVAIIKEKAKPSPPPMPVCMMY